MSLNIQQQVEKVNGKELSYVQFVQNYLVQNQPVILTGLMDDWKACKDWVHQDGKPNLKFISTHFGKSQVQVADCGIQEFTDQKRMEMSVSEFIMKWVESKDTNGSLESNDKPLLYLKDWHFVKEYPEYCAYKTPVFFCDDWLNMYLDRYRMHMDPDSYQENNEISCSDYRFVYMGAKGTWTPLHADVFRSYSWSANVCGKKQWFFLPPSKHHLVFDRNMKNSIYNIFEGVDDTKFPCFREAIWWECTQEENEIIFVPSGWYHQVHNLEDTISINHNWFNAYNVSWVWDLLLKDYKEARYLIEDIKDICDDFEGLCQRNLAANSGMNFHDILAFMVRITLANLFLLHHLVQLEENPLCWSSGVLGDTVFNLQSIQRVALKMKSVGASTNIRILIDLNNLMEDYSFLQLFATLKETYGAIHGVFDVICEEKVLCSHIKELLNEFSCSFVGSEDLDLLVDFVFRTVGFVSGENMLLEN
ncbi:OLC1v1013111C1 [Oldenlandia corymbosa var. corymbosa]|uniref:OLC1v1013111C1 n=1 Tax=Oldenlandia corymbosa var. corymbosa TaxID=529605 RepID=A0AAV1DXR8_OLDCO|nr:OLC1v1013111C1 [Oldenlandia corymbosa var. corymbosa]